MISNIFILPHVDTITAITNDGQTHIILPTHKNYKIIKAFGKAFNDKQYNISKDLIKKITDLLNENSTNELKISDIPGYIEEEIQLAQKENKEEYQQFTYFNRPTDLYTKTDKYEKPLLYFKEENEYKLLPYGIQLRLSTLEKVNGENSHEVDELLTMISLILDNKSYTIKEELLNLLNKNLIGYNHGNIYPINNTRNEIHPAQVSSVKYKHEIILK